MIAVVALLFVLYPLGASYKKEIELEFLYDSPLTIFDLYGFEDGGFTEGQAISSSDMDGEETYLLICKDPFFVIYEYESDICEIVRNNGSDLNCVINMRLDSKVSNWSYTFSEEVIHDFLILNCNEYSDITLKLEYTNKNPSGYLSTFQVPMIEMYFYLGLVWTAIYAYWIVNWIRRFQIIKLHVVLTVLFFFQMADLFLSSVGWDYVNKTGDEDGLPLMLLFAFDTLKKLFFYAVLLLASRGWSIISSTLTGRDRLSIAVQVTLLVFSMKVQKYVSYYFLFMVSFFNVALLYYVLRNVFMNIEISIFGLRSQLALIRENGIDEVNTPVYLKFKLFTKFKYVIVSWIILLILYVFSNIFIPQRLHWVFVLIYEIVDLYLYTAFVIIFRMRPGPGVGAVPEYEGLPDEEIAEISNPGSDFNFPVKSSEDSRGGGRAKNSKKSSDPVVIQNPGGEDLALGDEV